MPTAQKLKFRPATRVDVDPIVKMLADDPLGSTREQYDSSLPESYYAAFDTIDRDENNELVVAYLGEEIVGVLQLTIIPYLTYQGRSRALIEGVRVSSSHRSMGIGQSLFEWAIKRARQRGCHMVQLTTDKNRPDALRFYLNLGFVAIHEGLKLKFE